MLNLLRKSSARKVFARGLYDQLVTRARAPLFFTGLLVPDSIDGRFDLVTLHTWLALERLQAASLNEAAQALTDIVFIGFDEALREQGTGDMGMGRRMKAMADAFFGRLTVYRAAADQNQLAAVLAKNVWRGIPPAAQPQRLAAYVDTARAALAASGVESGDLDFGPLP
jgi:cytochrome b pre-mRNA-processing protein 3